MRAGFLPGALILLVLGPSGCSLVGLEHNDPPPPMTRTRLSIWNRTEHHLFLVDQTGRRIDVPACGEAIAEQFQLDEVTVRAPEGYISTFGAPARAATEVRPMFLVITASHDDGQSYNFPLPEEPADLPPCEGQPQIQVGQ